MKKRILCFGDSNTYGLIPGTKKQYNEKDCYTGILNQLLGDNYEVFADGLCGRTTIFDKDDIPGRTSIRAIKESVNHYTPDILIIMLGTNDCKTQFETDAKEIANGLLLITKQALETNPNLTICIVSPIRSDNFRNSPVG